MCCRFVLFSVSPDVDGCFGESRRIIGEKYSPDDVDEWSINGVNLTEKNPSLSNPPLRLRRRRWSLVVVVFLLVQDFGVLLPLLMETLQQLH